jgi:phospholipid transport system transporter-binding protein
MAQIVATGERWRVEGPLTLDDVPAALVAGDAAWGEAASAVVDLGGLAEVDSSAIAAMLHWLRRASEAGRELRFVNWPAGLGSLVRVYGVEDLFGRDGA